MFHFYLDFGFSYECSFQGITTGNCAPPPRTRNKTAKTKQTQRVTIPACRQLCIHMERIILGDNIYKHDTDNPKPNHGHAGLRAVIFMYYTVRQMDVHTWISLADLKLKRCKCQIHGLSLEKRRKKTESGLQLRFWKHVHDMEGAANRDQTKRWSVTCLYSYC